MSVEADNASVLHHVGNGWGKAFKFYVLAVCTNYLLLVVTLEGLLLISRLGSPAYHIPMERDVLRRHHRNLDIRLARTFVQDHIHPGRLPGRHHGPIRTV